MRGRPFEVVEASIGEVVSELASFVVVTNDPPWARLAKSLPTPADVVIAADTSLCVLEALAARPLQGETIVGLGGGTAMDTAKFLAWRHGRPLIQIPSITSVDAAFTDAIGVRVDGRVRYVGRVEPRRVVLDLDLIRSAPPHLNRAGLGDILSCHTGLFDWRLASREGHGPAWREDLANLGRTLLGELKEAIADIAAVSEQGVRFMADAYRRIGAACAEAGHSRFEEGSEHFWAYALEADTAVRYIHGELIACGVVAMSVIQDNAPRWAADMVRRGGVRAHPADLGISEAAFKSALANLASYARAEGLDVSIADLRPISATQIAAAWEAACALPRRPPVG